MNVRTPQPFREFATPAGGRATLTLHDGTRVVLGPSSHLRVPEHFGERDRTVQLDGLAYFAVVHNAAHPFAVQTSRTTVRDLGTQFVVRAYDDDALERVAVAEGEVAVGMGRTTLRAGDIADVATGAITVAHAADLAVDMAWVQGQLAFHATPLRDAIRQIERTYDLHITIADSTLAEQPITGAFGDLTADEVLDGVTRIVGAQYQRVGRRIAITKRVGVSVPSTPSSRPTLRMASTNGASR